MADRSIKTAVASGLAVTYADMATNSIGGTNIRDGTISYAKMATNSIGNTDARASMRNPILGVTALQKIASGSTLTVSGRAEVASGLTTLTNKIFCSFHTNQTATLNTSNLVVGFASGTDVVINCFNHAGSTTAYSASTTRATVNWLAFGT